MKTKDNTTAYVKSRPMNSNIPLHIVNYVKAYMLCDTASIRSLNRTFKLFSLIILMFITITGCTTESSTVNNKNQESLTTSNISDSLPTDTGSTEANTAQSSETAPDTQAPELDSTDSSLNELSVHYIDVGQGDSILITCGGESMLIDAGTDYTGTLIQSYLQKQGVSSLKYVIGTHPDADHIGGLDVIIYKFECSTILMPDFQKDTRAYDDVIQTIKNKNYTITYPIFETVYSLGDASFTIITQESIDYGNDANNHSIGILLTHGENRFLFNGDNDETVESDILSSGIDISADVYMTAHHGSRTSSCEDFIDAISPTYAVISCGEYNTYGHPHAQTLNTLRARGIKVFRTDEQGSITATSNGSSISFNCAPSETWQSGEPTGSSTATKEPPVTNEPSSPANTAATYIANINTYKFHYPNCNSVNQMSEKNKLPTTKSRDELIADGYVPCKNCKP